MSTHSYRRKLFLVEDANALIRDPADLTAAVTKPDGSSKTIPPGTSVKVTEVQTTPAGSKAVNVFAFAVSADGASQLGWTSARNFKGQFLSETLGAVEPQPGAAPQGPNAAWANGTFIKQITLIAIVGTNREIEYIGAETADAFLAMAEAARGAGRTLGLNSGFRSYPEQQVLSDGWQKRLPGFNPANPPGHSNHQNGLAFDIDVGAGPGNATYNWLAGNATGFGFVRTVRREVWHWEYLPEKAREAKSRGSHETYR